MPTATPRVTGRSSPGSLCTARAFGLRSGPSLRNAPAAGDRRFAIDAEHVPQVRTAASGPGTRSYGAISVVVSAFARAVTGCERKVSPLFIAETVTAPVTLNM